MSDDLLREFAEQCRKKMDEFDSVQVKCGIIGQSGSGKSTLINAIAGEKIAPTGVVETTNEPLEYNHRQLVFVDLPGCGTNKWPKDEYIERLNLYQYDCFLLVTANRFTENDVFLFRKLSLRDKPCFVVRSKFDETIANERHDNGRSEEETRRIVENNIRENLGTMSPEKVFLVSGRSPSRYDFASLLSHITDSLDGLKRDRFIADMAAYSEDALKKKRWVACEMIPWYAGLAAANGLNPIVGLDVAADIGILLDFGRRVTEIYGLTKNQFEFIKRLLGPNALPGLVAKVAQFTFKYLSKEGVVQLLKSIAGRLTAQEVSKWIPFVGQLIAAGIGWQATFMLCNDLVGEAEALALEILQAVIRGSDLPESENE